MVDLTALDIVVIAVYLVTIVALAFWVGRAFTALQIVVAALYALVVDRFGLSYVVGTATQRP